MAQPAGRRESTTTEAPDPSEPVAAASIARSTADVWSVVHGASARAKQDVWPLLRSLPGALVRRPEIGGLVGATVVLTVFSLLSPHFLTVENSRGVLRMVAEIGIVAIGVTGLMIAGEFDLSVGSILGLSSLILPLAVAAGMPTEVGIALALLGAIGMGLVNGLLVVRLGISSFIATLATMLLYRGLVLAVSGGFSLELPDRGGLWILGGRLPGGYEASLGWLVGVVCIVGLFLARTPFGNWVYATGGNRQAARSLGVPVGQVKLAMFTLTGLLAGLVGLIQVARFQSVDPLRGTGVELEAITTVVIGGALLTGGAGTVWGTVVGALTVGMVSTGLILAGAPPYYYQAFIGVVLVVSVVINLRVQRFIEARR